MNWGGNYSQMTCARCGSPYVSVQAVSEAQPTGCMTILFYLFLFVTVLGWVVLIPILLRGKKTRTVSYSVCQSCGTRRALPGR